MAVLEARRVQPRSWANVRTVVGLLLFCVALFGGQRLLQGSDDTVSVWAAARDLPANSSLGATDVRAVDVRLGTEQLDRYIAADERIEGAVLARPVLAGEMISAASVSESGAAMTGRAMTVPTDLVDRVRGRLASSGMEITSAEVARAVREEAGGVVGDADVLHALRLMRQEFVGAGPLDPLLRAPGTTDVLVTGADQVWLDGDGGLRRTDVTFPDEDAVRRLA